MQMRLIRSEVLELRGADALAFAHAQFMNDARALNDGQWQWSGWLTPKGRLVAFFAVVRPDAQTLLVWLPAGGAMTLADRLRRFVFRSKVSIDAAPGWKAFGAFADPATTNPSAPDNRLENDSLPVEPPATNDATPSTLTVPFPVDPDTGPRWLVLQRAQPAEPSPDGTAIDPDAVARWQRADMMLGVPYIAADTANSEQFVPQWLSLERLNAFNLKKGCYPGQEIVARMHYLGQSKRAAYSLRGEGACPGPRAAVLDADGQPIGEVVWAQYDDPSGWLAQAVLTTDRSTRVASVEGSGPASLIGNRHAAAS